MAGLLLIGVLQRLNQIVSHGAVVLRQSSPCGNEENHRCKLVDLNDCPCQFVIVENFLFVKVSDQNFVQYILRENTNCTNQKKNWHRKAIGETDKGSCQDICVFSYHPELLRILVTCFFAPNSIHDDVKEDSNIR